MPLGAALRPPGGVFGAYWVVLEPASGVPGASLGLLGAAEDDLGQNCGLNTNSVKLHEFNDLGASWGRLGTYFISDVAQERSNTPDGAHDQVSKEAHADRMADGVQVDPKGTNNVLTVAHVDRKG